MAPGETVGAVLKKEGAVIVKNFEADDKQHDAAAGLGVV
jgi:hypothetical protein